MWIIRRFEKSMCSSFGQDNCFKVFGNQVGDLDFTYLETGTKCRIQKYKTSYKKLAVESTSSNFIVSIKLKVSKNFRISGYLALWKL